MSADDPLLRALRAVARRESGVVALVRACPAAARQVFRAGATRASPTARFLDEIKPYASRAFAALALAGLAACAEPTAPATPIMIAPAAATEALSASPSASASATPAAKANGDPRGERHRVALELRRGEPPCTFSFDAQVFDDQPDWFVAGAVTRIATEDGGSCAASVLYDVRDEKPGGPNEPAPTWLEGSPMVKPGHAKPADLDDEPDGRLVDFDFDGWADLCFVELAGGYNAVTRCWLFDPQARRFVRNRELDFAIRPVLDAAKKTLTSTFRVAGRTYGHVERAWDKGKLVTTLEITTTLGERPDGSALPKGFDVWLDRRERRGDKLVTVKSGPAHGAP